MNNQNNAQQEIQSAKAILESHGYFTDNLWSIQDVQSNYLCTAEQAQEILETALTNEATVEQIWFAINDAAREENLPKFKPYLFSISGYYKDDKSEFSDYLVYEYDNQPLDDNGNETDDDIFYYGLSEHEITQAISEGENTSLEFVITSYERVIEN
jgi:hypothetical protein